MLHRPGLLILILFVQGCATTSQKDRILWGAGIGATSGATGGALLSPNEASRGLNALVFGLGGAVAGGLIGLITTPSNSEVPSSAKLKDLDAMGATGAARELAPPVDSDLPPFLKQRFRPAVIEESIEADSISEDGTLAEPHKVYRIKRPAELFSRPNGRGSSNSGTGEKQ